MKVYINDKIYCENAIEEVEDCYLEPVSKNSYHFNGKLYKTIDDNFFVYHPSKFSNILGLIYPSDKNGNSIEKDNSQEKYIEFWELVEYSDGSSNKIKEIEDLEEKIENLENDLIEKKNELEDAIKEDEEVDEDYIEDLELEIESLEELKEIREDELNHLKEILYDFKAITKDFDKENSIEIEISDRANILIDVANGIAIEKIYKEFNYGVFSGTTLVEEIATTDLKWVEKLLLEYWENTHDDEALEYIIENKEHFNVEIITADQEE